MHVLYGFAACCRDIEISILFVLLGPAPPSAQLPAAFSASETFDVGVDLGSVVSVDYFDRRPFRFTGKIEKVEVTLK